eukprot:CAMPEP_0202507110 /NCGR_PEP_ID=MMETSP1361-20130828/51551_1 /ASSEMBLY_ACC=CAM_ASM_000849 /TAXON_ID=210615 /ORGANISM="Staurosira complex sp., Strain CCMP2646" /LENGTH=366 /DNA_ID=CAMNT_0049141213 /DNA_START=42 /DNA_END=1142 /DNA_ORIENTATION=+
MFKIAVFAALATVVSAAGTQGYKKLDLQNFKPNAKLARNLLQKSKSSNRGLEDAFEETVVAKHSVIFDGCTNSSTWQDGKYTVVPLVRFTLCPTDFCASGSCSSSSYGEYVVDLPTFLDSYLEAQLDATAYKCEQMREQCGCNENNNYCLYYCYKNYDDDLDWVSCLNQQDEEARWAECERIEVNNDDGNRRLEQNGQEEEVEYYMGPICSSSGDAIYLSVFSDEDCTLGLSDDVYYNLVGSYHPNMAGGSAGSLVSGGSCISCLEPANADEQNDDDYYDQDEVIRFCEEIYNGAAKCETYMDNLYSKDEYGCQYIASLKSGRARRFLEAATSMTGSSVAGFALAGGMAVLVAGAALIAVKKFIKN